MVLEIGDHSLLLVLGKGGTSDVESANESWHEEHRSTIVPCPVAILALESLIEEESFDGCLPSCGGLLSGNNWSFPVRRKRKEGGGQRTGRKGGGGAPFLGHDVAEKEIARVRVFCWIKFKLGIHRNGVFRLIPNLSPGRFSGEVVAIVEGALRDVMGLLILGKFPIPRDLDGFFSPLSFPEQPLWSWFCGILDQRRERI
jgi:hypothetical protein